MEQERLSAYDAMPPMKAVAKSALPAICAMLMVLVYNLADTFFIGLTHDDLQVAAIQIGMPVFMVFMSLGSVFGIGGTSVIARALGERRANYAKRAASFCAWGAAATGVALSAGFLLGMDGLLRGIGVPGDTWALAKDYLGTVSFGGALVVLSECFANVYRAEGRPGRAMAGMLIGNIVNIALDPVMILGLGWGVRGAAVATVIGNVCAAAYYLRWAVRGKSIITMDPRLFAARGGIASGVLSIGVPAALGSLLMSLSQIVMNSLMSGYGSLSIAAVGVALKANMIIAIVAIGLGQGVQPLLGFAYGRRDMRRYKDVFRAAAVSALALGIAMTLVCYVFTRWIIGLFLTEPAALDDGVAFARILQSTAFTFGIFYCLTGALQAVGAAGPALIANISRQGLVYIPMLFALNEALGRSGLLWAQPVADVSSLALAFALHALHIKGLRGQPKRALPSQEKPSRTNT